MNTINASQGVPQNLLQILTKVSIDQLNAGDILQGRVQSLDNGMLLLKLLDGNFFTARVPDGFTASFGELITLEIGDRINDQLTAKILPNDGQKTPEKAGESAINAQIAEKLEAMGTLQPEKLIGDVLRLIEGKPGMPVDQAAFLAANRLDASPEMLTLVQKISEHQFQLQDNLMSLKDDLGRIISEMNSSARQEVLKPLVVSQALEPLTAQLDALLPDASWAQKEAIVQNVRELLTGTLLAEVRPESAGAESPTFDVEALRNMLLQAENQAAEKLLLEPGAEDKLLKEIQNALEKAHAGHEALGDNSEKEVKALLEELFDKAVIKAECGKVEDTDLKEKARALKDVMDFSQKVLNTADARSHETSLNAFKEINDAFRFFNQVTTYDSMLQLPIRINKKDTTGELYVMKRKNGRKKLDAENFTLFLSLKTEGLGRVESFLNSSQKYVTISFRVEDEKLVKLVKENHRVLYDALLAKGYKLAEMKCRVLEDEPANLLNASKNAHELLGLQARLDIKL